MLEERIEAFRAGRRELERAVLSLATSIDGRRFSFQASAHDLQLQVGGYVVLEADGPPRLGQLLSLELGNREAAGPDGTTIHIRHVHGDGAILDGEDRPFHDASVRPATAEEVRGWLERTAKPRARLRIGELALAEGVAYELDAGGFDRHTFLCGQSGSGKTYSLGVILEQLLTETSLRILILDPNSDFVRLARLRPDTDSQHAERYREAAAGVAVHAAAGGDERLRLRAGELDTVTQAALLQLDPVADREEYAELAALLAEERPPALDALMTVDRPEARRAGAAPAQPRHRGIRHLGAGAARLGARGARPVRPALPGRGPRLAAHARGAGARGRGGPAPAVARPAASASRC